MSTDITRAELAARIDHTLLKPEASTEDVRRVALEGNALGAAAVCVSPNRVGLVAGLVEGPAACAVVGFPSGAHRPEVLVAETRQALADGANEVDMVIDIGAAVDGDWETVRAGVRAVRAAGPDAVLKVICESAVLDDAQLTSACRIAIEEGAQFVKTSTGMHPAGGATLHAVELMAALAHPAGVQVKASGGIRTTADALAMLAAGADRLGCSATQAILDGLDA